MVAEVPGKSVLEEVDEVYRSFGRTWTNLHEVVRVTTSALLSTRHRLNVLKAVAGVPPGLLPEGASPVPDDAVAQAEDETRIAQREVRDDFPLIHGQAAVMLWSILEALVRDVVALQLRADEEVWLSPALGRIKLPIADYHRLDPTQRARFLVALIEREADVIGKRGTTRFEAVLNYVGLSGETPDIVRRAIYELQQIRHCIVHNGARADTQLLAACPWLSLSLGDDIRVSSRQFSSFTGSANYYAYELYRRTKVKHGGDAATTEERLSNLLTALKPLQDERAGEVEA